MPKRKKIYPRPDAIYYERTECYNCADGSRIQGNYFFVICRRLNQKMKSHDTCGYWSKKG